MNSSVLTDGKKSNIFGRYLKGSVVALVASLVGILLFALVLQFVSISESAIGPINQIIKAFSILIGAKVLMKGLGNKGWLHGAILGFIYTILAYLLFSFLSSSIVFDNSTLIDLIFGVVMGAICGIIMVNAKK